MYDIQLNASGTRHLEIDESVFQTIEKYHLFQQLVNSTGYVTEHDLTRLKLTVRNLIDNDSSHTQDLLDLCNGVIFHEKMKAFGLHRLTEAYKDWKNRQESAAETQESAEELPKNAAELAESIADAE